MPLAVGKDLGCHYRLMGAPLDHDRVGQEGLVLLPCDGQPYFLTRTDEGVNRIKPVGVHVRYMTPLLAR